MKREVMYEAPLVEVIEVEVEKGFVISPAGSQETLTQETWS